MQVAYIYTMNEACGSKQVQRSCIVHAVDRQNLRWILIVDVLIERQSWKTRVVSSLKLQGDLVGLHW